MPDFLKVLLSLVLWTPALMGWGAAVYRSSLVFEQGLLGITLVTLVALWWNLLFPVGTALPVVLWGAGVAFFLVRNGHAAFWRAPRNLALAAFAALLTASNIFFSEFGWDVGFYYLPIIEWASQQSVPLGLANLFPWFGHNNSWFTFSAALRLPLLDGAPSLCANALLNLFVTGAAFERAWKEARAGETVRASTLFLWGTVVVGILEGSRIGFTHGAAQINDSVLLFGLYTVYLNLRRCEHPAERPARELVWWFTFFLLTQRVSAAPFLGLTLLTEAWLFFQTKTPWSFPMAIGWRGAILVVPFAIRGWMTSGCLLFPFPASCWFPRAWSVPIEEVRLAQNELMNGARLGPLPMGMNSEPLQPLPTWIGHWFKTILRPELGDYPYWMLGAWAAAALAAVVLKPRSHGWCDAKHRGVFGVWIFSILALGSALLTAPRLNYYRAFAIVFAALPVVYFLRVAAWERFVSWRRVFLTVGSLLLLQQAYSHRFLRTAGSDLAHGKWPREMTDTYSERKNAAGQTFFFPSDRDRCFDIPLPCSPYSLEDVEFQKIGNRYVFVRQWLGRRKEWEQNENRPNGRAFH